MRAQKRYFTMVVERDPESGWLVGEVAELPGCYTQAPDLPTLEKNIQEAVAAYLQEAGNLESPSEFIGTIRVGVSA